MPTTLSRHIRVPRTGNREAASFLAQLDDQTRRLKLDLRLPAQELARVAARTQERRFAPLACYMAGVAAEKLRVAKGGIDDTAVAAFILEVRQRGYRGCSGGW